jgi:hypothetical protein
VGGHISRNETTINILQAGLWWPTLFKDAKEYSHACNLCQRVGKPSHRDEFPLHLIHALQAFEKWVVDFIGPINSPANNSKERYIITATNYLTCWAEAEVVRDFSTTTAA